MAGRLLLIRPGGIGDCLLCFPAMQALAAGAGYTEVWTTSAVAPLVQFAGRVRAIPSTGIDMLGIPCRQPPASLVNELRSFDRIVSWYGANREEFALALLSLGVTAEFRTAIPPVDCGMHAVEFFGGSGYPKLSASAAASDGAEYIAIHPFSGSTHKNWPLSDFRALESSLPYPVRYCASPEQPLAGAVQYASLCGLAAWLRAARLYIGNDSGITHLAAAAGVPTVAIFGPSNPAIWAPRGEHVRVAARDAGAVLAAARDLLERFASHADWRRPQSVWPRHRS